MKPDRNRQHHSERLRATICNPGAFKMSLPMVSRGDSNPMLESATSSVVLLLHGKPRLSDGWP